MFTISYEALLNILSWIFVILYLVLIIPTMFTTEPEKTFYRKHPGTMLLLSLATLAISIISRRLGFGDQIVGIFCWTLNSMLNFSNLIVKTITNNPDNK